MRLAKLSPRKRRHKLRVRRLAKKLLPRLLAQRRRREYRAALAAKRPKLPRWLQRQNRLMELALQKSQLVKPVFEQGANDG